MPAQPTDEGCSHGFVGFCTQCYEDERHRKKDLRIEQLEARVEELERSMEMIARGTSLVGAAGHKYCIGVAQAALENKS